MTGLVLLVGGAALLIVAAVLAQRRREQALLERVKRAGKDPGLISEAMDEAVAAAKAREEWWRRQNPR